MRQNEAVTVPTLLQRMIGVDAAILLRILHFMKKIFDSDDVKPSDQIWKP